VIQLRPFERAADVEDIDVVVLDEQHVQPAISRVGVRIGSALCFGFLHASGLT
jgi:hypothetical protein